MVEIFKIEPESKIVPTEGVADMMRAQGFDVDWS